MVIEQLRSRISEWCISTFGSAARADNIRSLGGHSGVTIGFDVVRLGLAPLRLVLKMPPAGVARKSNFDVLRQVPLLKVLGEHGVPAPGVPYHSDDETIFGGPYLMMTRLPGASLPDLFTAEAGQGITQTARMFDEAIATLLTIHAIDAERELAGWSAPRLIPGEIAHWVSVLHKTSDADWIARGMALHDRLIATTPRESAIGLVHGDYYSNNWLFENGHLTGVVDWEGTSIGPKLLDLGWLCMIYDRDGWGSVRRATMDWHPGPDDFIAAYARRSTLDLADLPFYRALAAYRLASLTAYYYELHRSGKRHNPAWDVFADSFVPMVDRAMALLETRVAQAGGHSSQSRAGQ